jgi:hypothetical protein
MDKVNTGALWVLDELRMRMEYVWMEQGFVVQSPHLSSQTSRLQDYLYKDIDIFLKYLTYL